MNKIIELKFGSHLYGTNTPASDMDFKAIYVPTAREIVLGNYQKTICKSRPKAECERNNKDDVDMEILSLDRYLELLMEGQTMALDILFAPENMRSEMTFLGLDVMNEIYANKDKLITRNVNAFVGYARQQAHKYGIKGTRMDALTKLMALLDSLPIHSSLADHKEKFEQLVNESEALTSLEKHPLIEIIDILGPNRVDMMPHLHVCGRKVPFMAQIKFAKEVYGRVLEGYGSRARKAHLEGGIDWKALSHAVRVNEEAKELLSTGFITFPRPEKDLLVAIKTGKMDSEEVFGLIEQGVSDLYDAHAKSTLREEPDREWAADFIYRTYSNVVRNELTFENHTAKLY
jgi:hypothetical protein